MSYVFYPDIYIVENLIMNVLILDMTARVLHDRCTPIRSLTAAFLSAVSACVMMISPIHKNRVFYLILNGLNDVGMVRIAFPVLGKISQKRRCYVGIGSSILLKSFWYLIRSCGISFLPMLLSGYFPLCLFLKFYQKNKKENTYLYEVCLCRKKTTICVTGFLDSGNQLLQPGSKKPVCILEYRQAEKLLNPEEKEELKAFFCFQSIEHPSGIFCYIPYRCIDGTSGLLPAFQLRIRSVRQNKKENTENIGKEMLTAVCKDALSKRGGYQMILHPQIIDWQEEQIE